MGVSVIIKLMGGLLILYAVYYAFINLFGTLPPIRERRKRSTWEVINWLMAYVRAILMAYIGFAFLHFV